MIKECEVNLCRITSEKFLKDRELENSKLRNTLMKGN